MLTVLADTHVFGLCLVLFEQALGELTVQVLSLSAFSARGVYCPARKSCEPAEPNQWPLYFACFLKTWHGERGDEVQSKGELVLELRYFVSGTASVLDM